MARLVSALVGRNLIEPMPVDRRSHRLILTGSGRVLVSKIKLGFDENERVSLERIPAAHRSAVMLTLPAVLVADLEVPAKVTIRA